MILVYRSVYDYVHRYPPIGSEFNPPENVFTGQVVVHDQQEPYMLAITRYMPNAVDEFGTLKLDKTPKLGAQLISLKDGNRWSEELIELEQHAFGAEATFSISFETLQDHF